MNKKTAILVKKLGVPPHLSGYDYIREAAELIHADRGYLRGITTSLYPTIAKKFVTTPPRVERAIRHAIEVAFNNLTPDEVNEFFGNNCSFSKGKPRNRHFLAAVAEMLEE